MCHSDEIHIGLMKSIHMYSSAIANFNTEM